ncbi:MAG: quinone oxidoreductase family protein [Vulcanimicrobiaceae bacterium]
MKAIQIRQTGGPAALELVELPAPSPGDGEVLVRQTAVGVNFIDVYHRNGAYAMALPFVPGMEAAGSVAAVGAGVTLFKPGDRVAYPSKLGAYAESAVVPAERAVAVPDGVSARDACALMLQGMTAHYLAHSTFSLQPGHIALVHAGAGGVGLLLTQLAKACGATVISTVSTEAKAVLSTNAGADHVILYTKEDFAAATRRIAPQGVDVVYDSVGKTTFDESLRCLRPRGMMVLYGGSSGQVPAFDLQRLAANGSLFVTRPTLGNYIADRKELAERARDLFDAYQRGALRTRIGAEYPLADARQAHADLEARKTTGKLLLIPPGA